jgi:hypothetical protein
VDVVTLLPLTLLLPGLLLGLLLLMEQVEQPLRRMSVTEQLEDFLDQARPEEVESFISEGYASALDRYWRRRRLLPSRLR